MASKNQVTLTFAGDADKLNKAAERAGASLEEFRDEARQASRSLDDVGDRAGDLDTRMMGFRDSITGVQDSMAGWRQMAEGDFAGGAFTMAMGIGDLASAVENLGVHMVKNAATMAKTAAANVANMARQTAAMVANVARQVAAWAVLGAKSLLHAAKVAAAWLISIGPLILVGVAVAALVYLIVKHWDKIKQVVAAGANWIKDKVTAIGGALKRGFQSALGFVSGLIRRYMSIYTGLFQSIVGSVSRVFSGVTSAIAAPFRRAFDGIRSAWNSAIGGKGFSVPSWVPGVGGKEFRIPRLAEGGILMPRPGGVPFIGAEAGKAEAVIPLDRLGSMVGGQGGRSGADGPVTLLLRSDGGAAADLVLELLRRAVDFRGGDVQLAVG